jgi:hypothetical protein
VPCQAEIEATAWGIPEATVSKHFLKIVQNNGYHHDIFQAYFYQEKYTMDIHEML